MGPGLLYFFEFIDPPSSFLSTYVCTLLSGSADTSSVCPHLLCIVVVGVGAFYFVGKQGMSLSEMDSSECLPNKMCRQQERVAHIIHTKWLNY